MDKIRQEIAHAHDMLMREVGPSDFIIDAIDALDRALSLIDETTTQEIAHGETIERDTEVGDIERDEDGVA